MAHENDEGFLYIASGRRRFTLQALRSAKTLKNKLPQAQITLLTDHIQDLGPGSYDVFSQVIVSDALISRSIPENFSWGHNILKKVKALKQTPYAKTIFLDSDTTIRSTEIADLFGHLEGNDICLTQASSKTSRSAKYLGKEIYYTGIIAYKSDSDKIKSLFERWIALFEENIAKFMRGDLDSPQFVDGTPDEDKRFLLQCSQTALAEILSPDANTFDVPLKVLDAEKWNHHSIIYAKDAIVEASPLLKFRDDIENDHGHSVPFPNTIVNTFLGLANDSREELEKLIRAKAEPYSGHISGHGGLRTMFDIHDTSNFAIRELQQLLLDNVNASAKRFFLDRSTYFAKTNARRAEDGKVHFGINTWAYVLDRGSYVAPHQHVGATLSATYYLFVSPEIYANKSGGSIQIFNPNSAEGFTFRGGQMTSVYSVFPAPDQFIMFPSYFWHAVTPVPDSAERIALTFDITVR